MRSSRCYWVVWVVSLLALNRVSAQETALPTVEQADKSDLAAITAIAEENSPLLRQVFAEIEIARGKALQVGLYPNPIASGGSPQWAGSESQYYSQLTQEIVTRGKLRLNRAAATREVTQAELRFVRARFDLLTAVRREYYSILANQSRVAILTQLVSIARESETSVAKLVQGGENTQADLLLIEIERQKAEVGLENAQAYLDANRHQLAATIGTPSAPIAELSGDLKGPSSEFNLLARREGALDDNALVEIARTEADRTRILLQRAIVEPFPNVTVGGGYMQQASFPNNIGLLSVEVPVPVWNRNQGNIRSARASISSATASIQRTRNDLIGQLAMAVGRYEVAAQQAKRFETAIIPKAKESLTITQRAIKGGQFSTLMLLQAQRSAFEADLGYINSLELRWLAAADIAGLLQSEVFP